MEKANEIQKITDDQDLFLSKSVIRKNFLVISRFLYNLTKSDSTTDEEFNVKYDVYHRLLQKHSSYGRYGQAVVFGGLFTYCMKGRSPLLKVFGGFMYTYWINHFFTLGSYVGLAIYLPGAVYQIQELGIQYKTGNQINEFVKLIKQREDQIYNNQKVYNDDYLIELMFQKMTNSKTVQEAKKRSYVANNFFEKNYDKFMKKTDKDENEFHIFENIEGRDDPYSDSLKLKYFDSFLTRYIYHSMYRWSIRMHDYLGSPKMI